MSKSMRGFSLIEMVIALALLASTITAVSFVALTIPTTIANAELKASALTRARELLSNALTAAQSSPYSLTSLASTTDEIYTSSLFVESREDESVVTVRSVVSWTNLYGSLNTISLESRVFGTSSPPSACDPFISGDWSRPVLRATYQLNDTGLSTTQTGTNAYSISALATTPSLLVVAVGSTTTSRASTLFFFPEKGTQLPEPSGVSFDNASTSRNGFSSLAVGDGYVFAGNSFGSKSPTSCSNGISCAQIQTFTASSSSLPVRAGSLSLSTSTPPYAMVSGGASAPANALTYHKHYLYLGLQKTVSGYEFNIVDARDPEHLEWVSGVSIGRSVNHITVRGSFAYVSTDDFSRELVVIDIHDPEHPVVVGSWDAPGGTGFGYATASLIRNGILRIGRTYVSGFPELFLLDVRDLLHISILQSGARGTSAYPESVRSLISQDTLTFALFTRHLEFWDTSNNESMSAYAPSYLFDATTSGSALACRNNFLYLARNSVNGVGYIDILQGS